MDDNVDFNVDGVDDIAEVKRIFNSQRAPPLRPIPSRRHSPARLAPWRQPPLHGDAVSESESGHDSATSPIDHVIDISKLTAVEEDVNGAGVKEGKSKIYVRLRGKNKCDEV
ncbi:hypothetical protein RHMOL_Rhmol02G0081300 [Rhododendron molle]|uniref:Uncharacterized protein n=1 Tax=Rhododendron molle TaxID=49168 RepID=A0ACC0PQ49_RHOML|nr:hypothetical protein RHMOL_Rhmol02G0081300 [Rhododendron molle]